MSVLNLNPKGKIDVILHVGYCFKPRNKTLNVSQRALGQPM